MTDRRAVMAACNNADWYAMMWDIHGLRYQRTPDAFCAIDPPPPYHSWGTLTSPTAQVDDLFAPYRTHPHFGLKDAFNQRDWSDYGLTPLFQATWIWAAPTFDAPTDGWDQIATRDELAKWETAWGAGSPTNTQQFPPAILKRQDVRLWGRRSEQGYDAGVIANLSVDCVGLSNSFGDDMAAAAATLCGQFGAGRPIVGYERGRDLDAARSVGFVETGLLTVWTKPG